MQHHIARWATISQKLVFRLTNSKETLMQKLTDHFKMICIFQLLFNHLK